VIDRDGLFFVVLDVVEDFLRQLDRQLTAGERRKGDEPDERALELANIRRMRRRM
jgi:hypothetical protein